ncbi:rho guanine nucleotide exchange factor osg-1 isoform X2 [Planococcus citri]|uniref:rho guanine nucleotide exchange factor osg-1 isoform X2 n=1 Tax=Planococcus citri TaxID=170843 RepID=UPI0031F74EEC
MTLGSVTQRYNALTTEGSDSSHSSISSIPASKFNDEISSVIKIGTVKVRFTQQNSNTAKRKNDHIAASPTEEAAKLAEEEEHNCCGVRWPPSRIPLAAYSNNRCRISLSRNTRTNEERRNFTRSPVRYCTSEWTQQVPHVRPSLADCFGRRNFKSKKCNRNDIECEPCAVLDSTDSSGSLSSTSYCNREQKNVFESAIVCSRESDCSIYNCDKRGLISFCEEPSTDSTLDRFQKFGFGGDRVKKNAGRRGSGGNHKKKTQRSSDKTINLKKLTDKLIQSSSHRSDHENNAEPESSSNAAAVAAEPPKPMQELIPLKLNTDEKVNDKDDIFEGVNLNLAKPESRTIVGSYYQRSIPFRSASFSQVHYSPEDRKYIRNSRKIGVSKKNIPNAADNCATLPRTNASTLSVADENFDSQIDVDNTNSFLSNYTFVGESKTAASAEPPCSNERETQKEPVGNEQVVSTELPTPLSNELPDSVSLIELEPAVPLKATITPINAPESDKPIPQAPKRSKHKHKHRHRHCGRLYFSDENIFSSNITDESCKQDEIENSESLPEILPVIRTAPNSDTEMEKEPSPPAPVAEITTESIETADKPTSNDEPDKFDNENSSGIEMFVTDWTEKEKPNEIVSVVEEEPPSDQSKLINETPTEEKPAPSLNIDNNNNAHSNENVDMFHCQTTPSSPEEMLKPQWPIVPRNRRLTPQTSTEKDDESESYSPRKYLYSRGDSFSETESDQGDKRSVSPGHREGRLSPLTYGNPELSDSDSRSVGTPRGPQSPVPYSKRPLRGPYLEMIVNEQKRPENKTSFADLQFLENRSPQNANWYGNSSDRAVDDYYLRRSNTSPNSNKLNVVPLPKRKISANIPFSSSASLRTTTDEKGVIHHQRTTSSPSQLEYYPDLLNNPQHGSMPSQQLLHQLLRGSSERSLVQDVGVDSLKNMYPAPTYKDTRSHIVVELYDTEHSYVESLRILVTKYLQPLKSPEFSSLIEPATVQEIFYQIPEILAYHEEFLEELRVRLEGWNRGKCIGDIFLETFTKETVIDSYIAFINNWKSAKEAIKQTCHMKPAFAKFLEAMAKEHKGKLALDSLLIMPVQRIPRYELLIQSLIKHTEVCHPDFEKLQEALHQVHELAVRINCTERENLELEQIENLIDGLGNLVSADRQFLRYDLVSMTSGQGLSRKERALFLFNDLLIITSVKRRSSTVKKPLSSSPGSIASSLEANKYKLLMKIPLEHLDIVKVKDDNLRRIMKEMEFLSEDVNTLSQMSDLVSSLHCPHSQLEESIREMLGALNKQLNERHISESQLSYLELALSTRNSVENISAVFPKPEKRTSWEETFFEAKARLNVSGDRRLCPEFLTSVPIRKTRAGLQFTCATAAYNQQDVWVCNSDGFVGQVCILSLHPEPAVTSCNGVCNARILSVTSVPVSRIIEKFNADAQTDSVKGDSYEEVNESIPLDNNEGDIPDIHLDSSSSEDEDGEEELSIEELKITDNSNSENGDSTMWLGTEDGYIYIFNCTDSLRVKRNKQKYKHNSAVYCILYHDKNVFVSLADGEVHVYSWSPVSGWNLTDPVTIIRVGCKTTPALRMLLVCGKLWCICHNIIKVISFQTLKVENSFTLNENNRAITAVAVFGYGVWLSLQNSAMLRVVHAISCEILAEVNVTQAVTKMLSGTDDIIRQHKSACLRVTALLACKDLLWIGTSAGVVLTMSLPVVKRDTTKLTNIQPPIGVPHGHTGQVRFLTSVKCTKNYNNARRSSKAASKKSVRTKTSKMLVISGGDGYEDFRSNSVPEVSGREDSTNHLLIWRV